LWDRLGHGVASSVSTELNQSHHRFFFVECSR
jgi:hypothetical protein